MVAFALFLVASDALASVPGDLGVLPEAHVFTRLGMRDFGDQPQFLVWRLPWGQDDAFGRPIAQ